MDFTLDYAKWRCGGALDSKTNVLGEGPTKLLNNRGFMCCLGQHILQASSAISEDDIFEKGSPANIGAGQPVFPFSETFTSNANAYIKNTKLSEDAMTINDNQETTPAQKIVALRALYEAYGHTLTVINLPDANKDA